MFWISLDVFGCLYPPQFAYNKFNLNIVVYKFIGCDELNRTIKCKMMRLSEKYNFGYVHAIRDKLRYL